MMVFGMPTIWRRSNTVRVSPIKIGMPILNSLANRSTKAGSPSVIAPRTPEGLERSRRARWKDGRYSFKRKEWRRQFRAFIRRSRAELRAIRCELKALVDATQFGPGAEAIPPARRVSIPEATLKRAPLASVRHAAVHRVHPRFSHSCTHGASEILSLSWALSCISRHCGRL